MSAERSAWISTWLPGLEQLRGYRRGWLRGDLLAGITVAAYLVPQVMAYAVVAGLPPVTGLWATIGPLAVYAVLGSSRQLSVGPESTTALMTAVLLMPLAAGEPARYASLAAALAILVGGLCLLGRLARLGFLADLLSKPVLVGYMAGVAVIMIVSQLSQLSQLSKVTGAPVEGDGFLPEAASFLSNLGRAQLPTLALSVALLVLLLLVSWRAPRAPGPLIVVVLGALVWPCSHCRTTASRLSAPFPLACRYWPSPMSRPPISRRSSYRRSASRSSPIPTMS